MANTFRHRIGEVIEVTPLANTVVHGEYNRDGVGITAQTIQFNRCRVKWDDGKTKYFDCGSNYSPGDKIAFIVNSKGLVVADLNIATRQYRGDIPPLGALGSIAYNVLGFVSVLAVLPAAFGVVGLVQGNSLKGLLAMLPLVASFGLVLTIYLRRRAFVKNLNADLARYVAQIQA